MPLDHIANGEKIDKAAVAQDVKAKSGQIVEAKGDTAFGIDGVTASLCKSILFDQRNIRPVSHWQEDLGVCLSMPPLIRGRALLD